jgi:RNA polymerase sigma factor for flagellar operon FliA
VDELREQLNDVAQSSLVMLEDASGPGGADSDRSSLIHSIADMVTPAPGAAIETSEAREELREALEDLEERERLVIALYYFEGLTLAQIGRALGVTESRVSQIHTKAMMTLRVRFRR